MDRKEPRHASRPASVWQGKRLGLEEEQKGVVGGRKVHKDVVDKNEIEH